MHNNVYLSYNKKPSIPTPIFRLDSPPCPQPVSDLIPTIRRVHSCEQLLNCGTLPSLQECVVTFNAPCVEIYPTTNFASCNEAYTEVHKSNSCCEESNEPKGKSLSKLFSLVSDFQYYCMTKNQNYKYTKTKKFPRLFNKFGKKSCCVGKRSLPRRDCSSNDLQVRYTSYCTSSESSYEEKFFNVKKEKNSRSSSRSSVRDTRFKKKSPNTESFKKDQLAMNNYEKVKRVSEGSDQVSSDEDDVRGRSHKSSIRTDNRVTFSPTPKRHTITSIQEAKDAPSNQPDNNDVQNDSNTVIKVAANGSNLSVQYSASKNTSKNVKISTFDNSKTPLMNSKMLKTSTPNKESTGKSDGYNESTTLKLESTRRTERGNESVNNRLRSGTDQTTEYSQNDSLEPSFMLTERKSQNTFGTKSNIIKINNDSGTQFPETIISAKRLSISVGTSPSSIDGIATRTINPPAIFSQYKAFGRDTEKRVDDIQYSKSITKDWRSKAPQNNHTELPDYEMYIKSLYDTIKRCTYKDEEARQKTEQDFYPNNHKFSKNIPHNDLRRYNIKNHPHTADLKSSLKRSSRGYGVEDSFRRNTKENKKVSIIQNVEEDFSDDEAHNAPLKTSRSVCEHGSRESYEEMPPKEGSSKKPSKSSLKKGQFEYLKSDQRMCRETSDTRERWIRDRERSKNTKYKDNSSEDEVLAVKRKTSQITIATQYSDEDYVKSRISSKNSSLHERLSKNEASTQYSYEMVRIPKEYVRVQNTKVTDQKTPQTDSEIKKSEKSINFVSNKDVNKRSGSNTTYSANVKSDDPFMVVYVPKIPKGSKEDLEQSIVHGVKRALEATKKRCGRSSRSREVPVKKPTQSEIDVLTDSKLRL